MKPFFELQLKASPRRDQTVPVDISTRITRLKCETLICFFITCLIENLLERNHRSVCEAHLTVVATYQAVYDLCNTFMVSSHVI